MKHISKLLFLFLAVQVNAQNLLSNPDFETGNTNPYLVWVSPVTGYAATMSISSVNPHAGTKALMMDVTQSDPTNTNYYDKIWRVQATQSGFTTTTGEMLLFSFWARADAPHTVEFGITKNSGSYADYSIEQVDLTTEWKKYEMVFVSPVTGTDIRIIFKCGNALGQYFFDDVSLVSQGISDQTWYAQAQTRIDQVRKGDFVLTVRDQNGDLLTNCDVTVQLKQHDFKWGTAVAFQTNPITADEVWYRNTVKTYFNNAVFENDFKWPSMEYANGDVSYSGIEPYLDWGNLENIGFRGHNLVWGGKQASPPNSYWLTPSWLWNVSSDSAYKLIERRVKRDVTYFKGRIHEYDVVNEAVHEKALANWLGDSVHVMAFKWAKQADPTAALYINDYGNIDGGATSIYKSYIQYLQSKGAPVEGIGIQGHFNTLIDWQSVKLRLDYLAELGLPLKITEFDINVNSVTMTDEEQAAQYAKMMRIAFSHPKVEGFLFWGFWDSRHWLPGAGLFRTDKTAKPAADSVYKLIHTTWSTTANLTTDANGQVTFRGYYGTYTVTADCAASKYGETELTKITPTNSVQLDKVLTTGTLDQQASGSLKAFPNPASNSISFVVPDNTQESVQCIFINTLGQEVSRNVYRVNGNKIECDIHTFKAGMYRVLIQTQDKSYVTQFVKTE
ncbi:endo-1,4-beta-xylanase [Cytophaga aurantiaca]|uniref:endo-1,4-beta-xylanase n=1 Tax=Cytophaga aurantiaca TaxID=29530 RepID=UPI000380BC27|nr:endo-1,4-beta-xylanase [Cytophaga aurantiaca]